MKSHDLAAILLAGNNLPVSIPSNKERGTAELIKNIFILQNDDSPFEFAILLEGDKTIDDNLIDLEI